jgi:hypothetical protein
VLNEAAARRGKGAVGGLRMVWALVVCFVAAFTDSLGLRAGMPPAPHFNINNRFT